MAQPIHLSVVIPARDEAESIGECVRELARELHTLNEPCEILPFPVQRHRATLSNTQGSPRGWKGKLLLSRLPQKYTRNCSADCSGQVKP